MVTESKVRFGLRNTKYFSITRGTDGTATFGEIKSAPNAVSMSMTREGGDTSDFYADDGVCYSFASTNGGYSMDWEFAKVTNEMRKDFLGELADDASGVQWEFANQQPAEMGIITEVQGDNGPTAFVFFGIKASRIEMSAETINDSPSVQTETMSTRCTGIPLKHWDGTAVDVSNCVKGFLDKSATTPEKYAEFFTKVVLPPTAAPSVPAKQNVRNNQE